MHKITIFLLSYEYLSHFFYKDSNVKCKAEQRHYAVKELTRSEGYLGNRKLSLRLERVEQSRKLFQLTPLGPFGHLTGEI